MLYAVANGIRLENLGEVDEMRKVIGNFIIILDVAQNLLVSARAFLMGMHDSGIDPHILLAREAFQRFHHREGLEAELRTITEIVLAVFLKGNAAVPHLPIMRIAHVFVAGIVEAAVRGGRGWPIEDVRRVGGADLGQDIFIEQEIIVEHLLRSGTAAGAPIHERILHFVVTAEESEAGVMADALQHVDEFRFDVRRKCLAHQNVHAGEHEILPDDQTVSVAKLVEVIVGIKAAAPHAQGIVIGFHAGADQLFRAFGRAPRQKAVLRNVVRAHREKFLAVNGVAEFLAVFVRLAADRQRAQTDRFRDGVRLLAVSEHAEGHLIERLIAEAVRPPELRVFYGDLRFSVGGKRIFARVAVGIGEREADRIALIRADQLGGDGKRDLAVLVDLSDLCGFHADVVRLDEGIAVQPHVGKDGTPIPAEHTGGFTDMADAAQRKADVGGKEKMLLVLARDIFRG